MDGGSAGAAGSGSSKNLEGLYAGMFPYAVLKISWQKMDTD
jgi:hypothetical protein